ncbi:MAG: NfeD family protein [Alphaproteobacteria bacterium]|nr:NfeD family protein [Alphaproteobacteria bacterium]
MTLLWHHWAILGVALVVGELLVPAFVLVWFGLGALIVAALLAIAPDTSLILQILLWIASSITFVFLWFKLFKPQLHKTLAGRSQAEALGEVGLMVTNVEPFQKGSVRFQTPLIGSDVWECIADETITAGTRVKVTNVEGSLLRVTKA